MLTVVVPGDQNMPPYVFQCHHPLRTPKSPLLSQISPRSRFKRILHSEYCLVVAGTMNLTKKKLTLILFFVLCSASFFRFLKISMIINTNLSAPLHSSELPTVGSSSTSTDDANNILTQKEMQFLSDFFSRSVPCNLLVFGLEPQYSSIASLNADGLTIFLQDHLQKTSTMKSANNTQVHNIKYNTVASQAYMLLRDARENPHQCTPREPKCNLALTNLPQEVYDTKWDVVMVDGPSGDGPDSPGRMASIFTASVLARRGNKTHVIVHDVDRMIEKWFSWEFLCEENLVSSKGRFWHFQVSNATTLCTP